MTQGLNNCIPLRTISQILLKSITELFSSRKKVKGSMTAVSNSPRRKRRTAHRAGWPHRTQPLGVATQHIIHVSPLPAPGA